MGSRLVPCSEVWLTFEWSARNFSSQRPNFKWQRQPSHPIAARAGVARVFNFGLRVKVRFRLLR